MFNICYEALLVFEFFIIRLQHLVLARRPCGIGTGTGWIVRVAQLYGTAYKVREKTDKGE
jgi:hypothetical protein